MEIDRDIERGTAQPPGGRGIIAKPPQAGPLRKFKDVVDVRVAANHRGSSRFDEVSEMCRGVAPPQRPDQRGREDHVANQAKTNQEDLQGSIVASSISITGMSSLIG